MINSNITFVLLKKLTEQGISLGQHETEKLIYYVKGVTKSHLAFNSWEVHKEATDDKK